MKGILIRLVFGVYIVVAMILLLFTLVITCPMYYVILVPLYWVLTQKPLPALNIEKIISLPFNLVPDKLDKYL